MIASPYGYLDLFVSTDPDERLTKLRLKQAVALEQRAERLSELLDPGQIERLHQAAFRKEIAILGFGNAIAIGFFGENLGVDPIARQSIGE